MITVRQFSVNPLQVNCYVVSTPDGKAAVIDSAAYTVQERQQIDDYIDSEGLEVVLLLQTHMHFDHVMSLSYMANRYGVTPYCHSADLELYAGLGQQLQWFTQGAMRHPESLCSPEPIADGGRLALGDIPIEVIHTPGHTPGGVCFYIPSERMLFSGDSLFCCSVGRTDFPGGNHRHLVESLTDKVLTLPSDVIVYCGHGPSTTIGNEQTNNPYL